MKKLSFFIFIFLLLIPVIATADNLNPEIDHLMGYIRESGCKFIRNNKEYGPDEAVKHIMRKYGHFQDKIKTTEGFIELCASKSTVSSKPYKISCSETGVMESKQWLLNELKRFRDQSAY